MHCRSAFRKPLLFSALSLLLSAPPAFSDTAPVTISAANTGAATNSIPIDVPPGCKGIQSNLSLTYIPNNLNGWVGVG